MSFTLKRMSQFNTVQRCTNAAVIHHATFYNAVPYHNRIVDPTLTVRYRTTTGLLIRLLQCGTVPQPNC